MNCINKNIKFDLPEKRIYHLNPSDYKNPTEYQQACAERTHIEDRIEFRKYHEDFIQTTFMGVDSYSEGEVL